MAQLERQRLEEFGCSTDEEAGEYIAELEGQIARLDAELQEGMRDIREELGW